MEDCDDPPDKAPKKIDAPESGFAFDPAHAFEEFDLSTVKQPEVRIAIHDGLIDTCAKSGIYATLIGAPPPPPKMLPESYREPSNVDEIRGIFRKVAARKDEPLGEFKISVGKILPEHVARLGLTDFNEDIIFKHPGTSKAGTRHWQRNHDNTLNENDVIRLFRLTIWNPYSFVREDIKGSTRRLCFFVKDIKRGQITNVWVVKDPAGKLCLELVDSWDAPREYLEDIEK